jgi:hypothetical protein
VSWKSATRLVPGVPSNRAKILKRESKIQEPSDKDPPTEGGNKKKQQPAPSMDGEKRGRELAEI